jgi:hypothetical protein
MLPKNFSSVISVVVYTDICVFCLSIVESVDPQKCSLVWYTSKHGVEYNLLLHSRPFFFFFWTHMALNSLILHKPMSVAACCQNVKEGKCIDVEWFCLSWPTWAPCKPVDYRYSRLTDCAVSHCEKFVWVTSTVWLSESILIPFPWSLVCNVFSI